MVEKFDRFRIGSHVETNKLLNSIKGLPKDGYQEFVVGQNTSYVDLLALLCSPGEK